MIRILGLFSSLAFLLVSTAIFADDDKGDFNTHKTEILSHIDEKVQKMQEHKSCVQAAQDKEALKKCKESMHEWRKGERMEHMEKLKERLEGRMEKMQKKMDDMKQKQQGK